MNLKKSLFILSIALYSLNFSNTVVTDSITMREEQIYGSDYIVVGTINTSVVETLKLTPDIATFTITYLTEDESQTESANRNTRNMKNLKDYMLKLGVKESDLTTVDYKNYAQTKTEYVTQNTPIKNITSSSVILQIDSSKFYDVVNLLDKHGISDLSKRDSYDNNFYRFTIKVSNQNENISKKEVQNKYNEIEKNLKSLGITGIQIENFKNATDGGEIKTSVEKKKYFVTNTISIKVRNFDNIGKIMAKAQELKMSVGNNINYSLADETRDKAIEKLEVGLFDKLAKKAERQLGNKYSTGVPKSINTNNNYNSYDLNFNRSSTSYQTMQNAGNLSLNSESFQNINIETPSDYLISVTFSGSFDIIQKKIK